MTIAATARERTVIARPASGPAHNPMADVLRLRSFRLYWIGQKTSLLGDQFSLIALPWLVLQLSGDPLALGAVLALAGIPRTLFMLVGGAVTDRFSQRTVMLASDVIRLAVTTLLALLILAGRVDLWMVYVYALVFGIVDGFFGPASSSIVPQIVGQDELQAGNSITQATSQVAQFVGPVVAGLVIAMFTDTAAAASQAASQRLPGLGVGIAFAADALTFAFSVLTLWWMEYCQPSGAAIETSSLAGVSSAIKEGFLYLWHDQTLRMVLALMAIVNFLVVGPFIVGVPVLAGARFTQGAAAFGIIMSAFGGGCLLGIVLSGSLPRPAPRALSTIMATVILFSGLGFAAVAFITSLELAFLVALLMGAGNGYLSLTMLTVLQKRTPRQMMGRIMSLVIFASAGLGPLSQAIAGALIKLSVAGLFVAAGILLVCVAAWAYVSPAMRRQLAAAIDI